MHEQQRAPNVDVELSREVRRIYVLYKVVSSYTCIVDDNIKLKLPSLWVFEVVERYVDDVLRSGL